jgi:ATP-binding cassette, subfamily B, bacterial PglK
MKNKINKSTLYLIKALWRHLGDNRKKQCWLILVLMVLSSFMEIVSIGAIFPFLVALVNPEKVYNYDHELIQFMVSFLGIETPEQLIIPLIIGFIAVVIIAGIVRLVLLYATTRFSQLTGGDLNINIYRRSLYQKYSIHVSRNSSEIINGIFSKVSAIIGGVINPLMTFLSSIFTVFGILYVLFVLDAEIAMAVFFGFGLTYLGIIRYTRSQLDTNSKCVAHESTVMLKILHEGLRGIRDILIDSSQEFYCKLLSKSDVPLRRSKAKNHFISASPHFIIEPLLIISIVVLVYIVSQKATGIEEFIPVLGILAMSIQRLAPLAQQMYMSVSNIRASHYSLHDVVELLDQTLPDYAYDKSQIDPISFEREIALTGISFRYAADSPWILKDVNLNLSKGKRIGFVGLTGSGKSTLINIIMGLLGPEKGKILIDGNVINANNARNWQKRISHVPQDIFLTDSTIEENIAFGQSKEQINHERVKMVASQAQISEIIESWPKEYQTLAGEEGIRLSGGQRQRIGIARALYKQTDVLVLDEATSALDVITEKKVMDSINKLHNNMTILIIAHRHTTLKDCDQIINVSNESLSLIKYKDLIE